MARVVSSKIGSTDGVTTSSFVPSDWWDASEQATGDVFVLVATNDTGTTALSVTGGWTEVAGPAPSNSGCRTGVWYIRHTGTEITAPTIAGTNDDWAVCAVQCRGVDATTQIDVSAVTEQTASTQSPVAPSATTTIANALVLRIFGHDGNGTSLPSTGFGSSVSAARTTDNPTSVTAAVETQIEWQVQPPAGATGTFQWLSTVSDGGRQLTVCLRPAAGAPVPAHPRGAPNFAVDMLAISPTVSLLSTWHATLLSQTVRDGTTSGGAARNSLVIQNLTALANGMYGWTREIGQTQTATTGLAGIYGGAAALPATTDFSNALFVSWLSFSTSTTAANAGQLLYFRDAAGNHALIRPFSEAAGSSDPFRIFVSYLPDEVQASGGGLIDWSQITHVGCATEVTGTIASTGQRAVTFRGIFRVPLTGGAVPIVGGTASDPFSFRDIAIVLLSGVAYRTPAIQGAKQQLFFLSFQIGDGITETHFNGDATAAEFADLTFRGNRVRAGDVEIRLKLGASDSFRLGAASIGSGMAQKFIIDPASSTSATYDFAGTIFGLAVTLKTGIPVIGTTFSGCPEIDAQGADVENCAITGTTSSDTAIAFSANASLAGTAIDVVGTSAAHHIELGASVTAFDMTAAVLSGTPGTSNVKVLRTMGIVTITLALGQTEPTYTSSGATVVFDQPVLSTVYTNAAMTDGTSILARNVSAGTTIEYVASLATGTGYSRTLLPETDYTVGDVIEIRACKKSGTTYTQEYTYRIVTTAGGGSLSDDGVPQADAITTALGLEGSSYDTLFEADYASNELDVLTTADFSMAQWMAWYRWKLTSQTAMEDFWGAITINEDGSIRNNVAVLSMYWDNDTASDVVETTGRRFYRSDGARPIRDPTTGGGGVDLQWRFPVSVVSIGSGLTPSESAHLLSLDTDAVNVESINGADVIGTGTTGDAWRGVGVAP